MASTVALAAAACSGRPDGAGARSPGTVRPRPNIVVFLADTLRADHLGLYGYGRATSPHIDRFGREGLVFERCYSQCSWTKPSVASLFTGLLPRIHQAGLSALVPGENGEIPAQILRERFVTLAQALKGLGYQTAMFQTNPHIRTELGFARGFDYCKFNPSWDPRLQVSEAIRWIVRKAKPPFFLFVHEIDPHDPYAPSVDDFRRFHPGSPDDGFAALPEADRSALTRAGVFGERRKESVGEGRHELGGLSPQARELLVAMYDAEIAGVDTLFGFLLTALRAHGLDGNTAVALIGDHGEAFQEHGTFFHSNSLLDEEVRVPLVLRLPEPLRRHERISRSVALFDLYPTLVHLAGGRPPDGLQAQALLTPQGETDVPHNRPVFATLDNWTTDRSQWDDSMVRGPWKIVRRSSTGELFLYNRADDPGEHANLIRNGRAPGWRAAAVLREFRRAQESHLELAKSFGEPEWSKGGAEHREELRALGYL